VYVAGSFSSARPAGAAAGQGETPRGNLLAYDNLPIKGYAYPLDEVKEAHQFDTTVAVPGGEASVCSDCGFVLTDVNE